MVSIIIPCYNGEKFIERCFNSILNQTYKDLEVIVINDGSKDKSEDIINSFLEEFNRLNMKLVYVYQENRGAGGAINTGLKYVTGRYLTLLDIDDYIMPESIELKVKFLDKNIDFDIVRTNGYYVNECDLDNKNNLFIVDDIEKKNTNIFDDLIEAKTNNWAGSYMVRSDKLFNFYKDRNIYESRYGQNLQILLPIAYNGKSGFIDKPLMKYIRQESSLSQSTRNVEFDIKNMLGYKSIRVYMLNLIIESKEEHQRYLDIIEINYARCFMNLAIEYSNLDLLEKNYNILKNLKAITIEDKITYYNFKNKIIGVLYRVIRKINLYKKIV